MTTVAAELARLAAIGNKPADTRTGTRAIARELARHGVTGQRHTPAACALANHLRAATGAADVHATRYEVVAEGHTTNLNAPPGDLCVIRYFVCEFDDHPGRFPALRTPT